MWGAGRLAAEALSGGWAGEGELAGEEVKRCLLKKSMGLEKGAVVAEAEAPSRFGDWVTEARSEGRRADLSFVRVDGEIHRKHLEFGDVC